MVTFALRIPEDMKREMEKLDVNWSLYIRQSIRELLASEKKRKMMAKIQKMTSEHKAEEGTAVDLIREVREQE